MSSAPIHTSLGYLVPSDEKPIYYASVGGAEAELKLSAKFEQQDVTIADARELSPEASLDQEGFALVPHHSEVRDFYDDEEIEGRYNQEAEALVKAATGASRVVVFDNTRRSDASSIRGTRQTREPSAVIHNDYTDASAAKRVRDILPAGESEELLKKRFAIINVWRSIAGPVETTPLALCDATTVSDSRDLVASERRAAERIGELQLATHNPAHRWYWYSAMTAEEALLIKTFDSSQDGRARRSIHTAFSNPQAPATAAPRESLETRTFAFFD
ncbi:CmcJ/NvfI family oxidoreductase [Rhodovibrionaceae bacterium A322]